METTRQKIMVQHVRNYTHSSKFQLNYLLHVPPNPGRQKLPLIYFLHGSAERGSDPLLMKEHGIPKVVDQQPDFPFITVSPQCPLGMWWPNVKADVLSGLLD